jgi:hypothetical protein
MKTNKIHRAPLSVRIRFLITGVIPGYALHATQDVMRAWWTILKDNGGGIYPFNLWSETDKAILENFFKTCRPSGWKDEVKKYEKYFFRHTGGTRPDYLP